MSNKSFLHCSDYQESLPPFTAGADPDETVLLCCDVCIPLLWLPMFTPRDVRYDEFEADGTRYKYPSPVVEKAVGLERLSACQDPIRAVLGLDWDLSSHVAALSAFIGDARGKFLCMDAVELFSMGGGFEEQLMKCLRALHGEQVADPVTAIVETTTVMTERPRLLPVLEPEGDHDYERDDYFNLNRILGYGWYHLKYPWSWAA